MKIVVDCRFVRLERHDGISRFTARIVEALARRHPVTMLISDERQLGMLPRLPWSLASAPTSPLEPFVAREVNRLQPDVVYSPMQTMGSRGRDYGLVLTLHDLIYYRHRTPPRYFPWPVRVLWRLYHLAWWPQRLLLNRADEVVTVSETTRALIREHHLTEKPVTVVRNAADPPAAGRPAARSMPAGHDLVYMGSFMPYKNVETLARALHELPGYRLHLMSAISPDDRRRLTALAPPDALVVHDGASDEEYERVLAGATALVSASHDEGFGIPLVEAMAAGTPVVVSDIPIFREIAGDAALFVAPRDAAGFAAAIRELEDAAVWHERSGRSIARSELFDWDRSAAELLDVLERVARRPRPPR